MLKDQSLKFESSKFESLLINLKMISLGLKVIQNPRNKVYHCFSSVEVLQLSLGRLIVAA